MDLADLAMALEDHSAEHSWWLDPTTGAVDPRFGGGAQEDGAAIHIEPLATSVGYGDMEAFVGCVRDPRARDLLERAIAGRGAFRRFKDALLDFPELRRAWFGFHDARGERRAISDGQSSEVGIVTTFVQHVPEEGLDPESGRLLRQLFEDRMDVDYALANAAPADAARAVADAERLVKSIAAWMADRGAGR